MIRAAVLSLCLALGFCTTLNRDPLAAYSIDPKAFSVPVTTIYSAGF